MVLEHEYGINTGNRFINFVDHDEDPEEFIAGQTHPEEKPKKSTKDAKPASSATSAKKATGKTTTPAAASASTTGKATKENVAGKSTATEQRRPQSNAFGDNSNNQQPRTDSARGGGRGFGRRGAGSAGQERPAYEGGSRGGGQQRSQRVNKFEGQQRSNEAGGLDQGWETAGNDSGNNEQRYGSYRGRGRGGGDRGGGDRGGRGTFYNRNYEGGRGGGRGRGRGGRGGFNNQSFEEGSQQQQQQPQSEESNEWRQSSNFDTPRPQTARTGGQEQEGDASFQDRSFEPDTNRHGGRGHYRARVFHNNRNYDHDRSNQQDREGGEGGQSEYRHNRRQHDRQPRSFTSGVKSIEKKDGEGAHNWGSATEIPDEQAVAEELAEAADPSAAATQTWSERVDEAEKQMTLDEYKKQLEEKKRAQQEKLPQFNRRTAGEGEDPKAWQKFTHEYRKKNDNGESEEELEEGSDAEGEEEEDEQATGKKRVITIPLRFKPIETPRGSYRGGSGGPGNAGGRYHDRPYRDDQQQRPKSPNQQQPPVSEQTGDYKHDEPQQQQRSYRGGPRGQGYGRGENRRSYGNAARGSHGDSHRARADPHTPDFANAKDFPTLAKQQ